jgi:hypothetical protein
MPHLTKELGEIKLSIALGSIKTKIELPLRLHEVLSTKDYFFACLYCGHLLHPMWLEDDCDHLLHLTWLEDGCGHLWQRNHIEVVP